MIKNEKRVTAPAEPADFKEGDIVLDIETTGRYWRTSKLTGLMVISIFEGAARETALIMERESDEYDMLVWLGSCLAPCRTIYTFNGTSFDIPHLQAKFKAYDLPDPFAGKNFHDSFLELKPLYTIFGLPSRKLDDYISLMGSSVPAMDDAEKEYTLLSYYSYLTFMDGDFEVEDANTDDTCVYYTLRSGRSFPAGLSTHDGPYHAIFKDDKVLLSVRIDNGAIRRYFTNYKDYDYLPREGYAIHRSMSCYVEKSHKEKAVRENCFNLVTFNHSFLDNPEFIRTYISSALQFLRSR